MTPGAGQRFGPYEIQSRLGTGGMGLVFRAWDARLHREVALKLLQNDYAMPGMRERFLREARAASALNHPNICTIFDIGEQNGDPYLVMELLEGETLKDRILRSPLSADEIVCVGREVAQALAAAHAKGVVHRDIKPANIFLCRRPNGTVQAKVLDFGLAKIEGGVLGARQSRSLDLTAQGATVGTLAYMSPEQAKGEPLDARSDLFSLGVVLYEMATRHIPFPGATSALVFVKLLGKPPEPVRGWNDTIPRELERAIFKLLAKERTDRYQHAGELEAALDKVGEKGPGLAAEWLRKAVSSVPLGRADRNAGPARDQDRDQDQSPQPRLAPPPRPGPTPERRTGRRTEPDGALDQPGQGSDLPPRTDSRQSDAPQFLRPVARVPRGDTTPRPIAQAGPARTAAEPESTRPPSRQFPVEDAAAPTAQAPVPPTAPAIATRPSVESAVVPAFELAVAATPDVPLIRMPPAPRRRPVTAAQPLAPAHIRRRYLVLGAVVAITLGTIVLLILNRGHFGSAHLQAGDPVVVAEIENRTGDRSLDGTLTVALRLALEQSPYLHLRSGEAYAIARTHLTAQLAPAGVAAAVARQLETRAYLYGTVTGTSAPYTLHVDLLDTASNDTLVSAEEHVPSLQQIPSAIDRIADSLRASAGESGDSIEHAHLPLSREGSANLDALHQFAEGDAALFAGDVLSALRLYRQVAALDPRFVQNLLRLAALYRRLHAETAAAAAARQAIAADQPSERTRIDAQLEYEASASGDLPRAAALARKLLTQYPHDAAAMDALAASQRLQGRNAEALQTAQAALREEPYESDAYAQAEAALIGLDRYDAAFQLEQKAQVLGIERPGALLAAAYLGGQADALEQALAPYQSPAGFRTAWTYGLYLDDTGRLTEADALWSEKAARATDIPGLESTAGFLLAQGALDRALFGDCVSGLSLARQSDDEEQGQATLFNSGMANALCGNTARAEQIVAELSRDYPRSFAAGAYYLPDLHAAMALMARDPEAALTALGPARQYDVMSLTPYLRALAHVALHQGQIGIVDLQTVLAHRGLAFTNGSSVYPAAQLALARTFVDTGDTGNGAQAYDRFLELWQHADPGLPPLVEARARRRPNR